VAEAAGACAGAWRLGVPGVKRFEFRLERVLRLKRQRTRLAELQQKRARLAVEAIEARIVAIRADLARDALGLEAKVGRPLPVGAWQSVQARAARLGRDLVAAEADLRKAVEELERAAAARARAATEEEALLYLRRHAEEVHREAAARAEQVRLDELGLRRWQAAREATGGEVP
jgi:flagellar export protein FliJ